ncbi:hypothetical protein L596_017263 [Steinernema carpocapsae]|uniref:BED-type domain-containing protein n=1 Tax=Steinernema carpocapsae TaxID=34508 RepID=A0A4U5N1W1_STECR|nr:hypothetical protein L596_017263 [Steinernema carpocapsae]
MSDKYSKYFILTAGGPSNDDVRCRTCKAAVKRKHGNTTEMRNHSKSQFAELTFRPAFGKCIFNYRISKYQRQQSRNRRLW